MVSLQLQYLSWKGGAEKSTLLPHPRLAGQDERANLAPTVHPVVREDIPSAKALLLREDEEV